MRTSVSRPQAPMELRGGIIAPEQCPVNLAGSLEASTTGWQVDQDERSPIRSDSCAQAVLLLSTGDAKRWTVASLGRGAQLDASKGQAEEPGREDSDP